jgi:hypothetical protein
VGRVSDFEIGKTREILVVVDAESSPGRGNYGSWAILALMTGALVVPLVRSSGGYRLGSPGTNDLVAYWGAGQLLRQGVSPYDFDALLAVQRAEGRTDPDPVAIWNPPLLLVWIYPLLLAPFPLAGILWYALGIVLVAGCTALIWRDLVGSGAGWSLGVAWVAALVFAPVRFTLHMGQMSFLLLLGVAGFLHHAPRGRDGLAGACLALTAVKPHVVYLLWIAAFCWMVRERRWGVAAGVAAVLGPTVGLLAAFWPNALTGYRTILAHPPLHFLTPTLGGILRVLIGPGAGEVGLVVAAMVGLGLLLYLATRWPALDWRSAGGPLLLLSVATAPYGWGFDQAVLLVPYLGIIAWAIRSAGAPMKRVAVVACLVLLNAALTVQNARHVADVYLFWMPWALGVLFLACSRGHGTHGLAGGPSRSLGELPAGVV